MFSKSLALTYGGQQAVEYMRALDEGRCACMRTERAASLDCGASPAILFVRGVTMKMAPQPSHRGLVLLPCVRQLPARPCCYIILCSPGRVTTLSRGRLVFLQMTFFVCFVSDSRVAAGLMRGAATAVNT